MSGAGPAKALALLTSAQAALRARFDDLRRALDRRDETACRLAIGDFHDHLRAWTAAEEEALLPAVERTGVPGRDPRRELLTEYNQLRELTAHVRRQIESGGSRADVLGFLENLARRLAAHERGNLEAYYPAAAGRLRDGELRALEAAAPPP